MTAKGRFVLIDAGTGNLRSVYKALESLGAEGLLTDDPRQVLKAEKMVLPGVGAFGDFMHGLRSKKLDEAVLTMIGKGVPLLGICVGMQALFEWSEELGKHEGLGILPGKVIRFELPKGYKIPHTGWNQLWRRRESALLNGIADGAYVYFNHSYYCAPEMEADVAAETDYGIHYASVVQRDHIFGVQFHPEKSQRIGLAILENFLVI